jgi:hypothetical protein
MRHRFIVAGLVAASALSAVAAQEPSPEAAPKRIQGGTAVQGRDASQVALKVEVVLTRLQGTKKISSLPFVLGVVTNAGKTSVRVGTDVPVVSTVFPAPPAGDKVAIPQSSYSYRTVGTNIDCSAESLGDALYRLSLTVDDSSVELNPAQSSPAQSPVLSNVPSFRNFKSSFSILLRDGQTMPYTSAPNPVSGEVTKIDVGLSVVK